MIANREAILADPESLEKILDENARRHASQVIMLRLGTKWLYQLANQGELGDKTRQGLKMFCTLIGTLADEYANNPTGECRPPVTPKIESQSLR